MTLAELYQAARLRVRKSIADDLDQDVQRIAETAIADLKRIGVADEWLEEPSDPLIIETILSYVKANYSIDTDTYPILAGIYDMNMTKVKGDGKYFTAPDTVEENEPDTPGEDEPTEGDNEQTDSSVETEPEATEDQTDENTDTPGEDASGTEGEI